MLSNALNMKLDYFFRPFAVAIDTSKFEFRKKASIGATKVESTTFVEMETYPFYKLHRAMDIVERDLMS